jgi:hypothetical protein
MERDWTQQTLSGGEERRHVMSINRGLWRRVMLWAIAAVLGLGVSTVRADVVTDQGAAILIFPKIRVDTTAGRRTDTVIQITNTSRFLARVRCFYINANSHCSNAGVQVGGATAPEICLTNSDCNPGNIRGGTCVQGWDPRDFQLTLTKRQPLSWRASEGLTNPCPQNLTPEQCSEQGFVPLSGGRESRDGQDNDDTRVPEVQENPFVGELKCVQVEPGNELPFDRNDLKGEATIITTTAARGDVDVRKYNAIGIQATGLPQNEDDDDPANLLLGGPDAEYNACPNVLVIDHFFDSPATLPGNVGNDVPVSQGVATHSDGTGTPTLIGRIATDLVFVPCSEDILNRNVNFGNATLQLLVYNEFEQRFSLSTRVSCYKEIQLSDLDTRPGTSDNATSIYSAAVQGTLTGQTRVRPVPSSTLARRVLAIAEERWTVESLAMDQVLSERTTARNVHTVQPVTPFDVGVPDIIRLTCPHGGPPPCQ